MNKLIVANGSNLPTARPSSNHIVHCDGTSLTIYNVRTLAVVAAVTLDGVSKLFRLGLTRIFLKHDQYGQHDIVTEFDYNGVKQNVDQNVGWRCYVHGIGMHCEINTTTQMLRFVTDTSVTIVPIGTRSLVEMHSLHRIYLIDATHFLCIFGLVNERLNGVYDATNNTFTDMNPFARGTRPFIRIVSGTIVLTETVMNGNLELSTCHAPAFVRVDFLTGFNSIRQTTVNPEGNIIVYGINHHHPCLSMFSLDGFEMWTMTHEVSLFTEIGQGMIAIKTSIGEQVCRKMSTGAYVTTIPAPLGPRESIVATPYHFLNVCSQRITSIYTNIPFCHKWTCATNKDQSLAARGAARAVMYSGRALPLPFDLCCVMLAFAGRPM